LWGERPASRDVIEIYDLTAAPKLGAVWATNMISGTNNSPMTVENSWYIAGSTAYVEETNHITIIYRVAGWPDAFNEHITDINQDPGAGRVQAELIERHQTVYNLP
jgi:hypothetical protein